MKRRFWFTKMEHKVNPFLDYLLNTSLDSGVDKISSENPYTTTLHFINGDVIDFYNNKRYRKWVERGSFTSKKGDVYQWSCGRLRRKTMSRLYRYFKI